MSLLSNVKDLANQKGVSLAEVERKNGLSSGSITKWNVSSPSADKLEKVATYFNVSTDYLLGRENNKSEGIKNPEVRILARQLDKEFDAEQIEEFKSFAQYLRHKKFGDKKDGQI